MKKALNALVIAVIIFYSCDRHAGLSHAGMQDVTDQQHDHAEKESNTLFSGPLELYVEFNPLVVGHDAEFIIHLTNIETGYSPLTQAKVTMELVIDREVTRAFKAIGTDN